MSIQAKILEQLAPDMAIIEESLPVEPQLLRRMTMRDIMGQDETIRWKARGLMMDPTYGMLGGPEKTLKSYVGLLTDIAMASGKPVFNRFDVPEPVPIVAYVGEGGSVPYMRRMRRVAESMGINGDDLLDLPYHGIFDVAPIPSPQFEASLQRDLDEIGPGLVTIDPFYAYHGGQTSGTSLYEEGALLSGLSSRCLAAGASLRVTHHFRKNERGADLGSLNMTGGGQWSDSWWLLSHREAPDVENGQFHLLLDVASRQWGATRWDLNIDIGRFDPDLGSHDGTIAYDIEPHVGGDGDKAGNKLEFTEIAILSALADRPLSTKTDIKQIVKGNAERFEKAFVNLMKANQIVDRRVKKEENGRSVSRTCWSLISEPEPAVGTGWSKLNGKAGTCRSDHLST